MVNKVKANLSGYYNIGREIEDQMSVHKDNFFLLLVNMKHFRGMSDWFLSPMQKHITKTDIDRLK